MVTLLHSCVEVHEPIELSFGVVSVISEGMGVLVGGLNAFEEDFFKMSLVLGIPFVFY